VNTISTTATSVGVYDNPLSITSSGIINKYVDGGTSNTLTINGPNNIAQWANNTSRTYNIPDVGANGGYFLLNSSSLTPQQIYSPIKFTYDLNGGEAGMITGSLVLGAGGAGNPNAMTILNWDETAAGRDIQWRYQTGSYPFVTTYLLTRLASSFGNNSYIPGSQKGDFIITNDVQNSHAANEIPGGNIIITPKHGKKVFISASAATFGDTGFEVNTQVTYLKTDLLNVISSSLANSIEANLGGNTASFKQGAGGDARGSGRTQIFDNYGGLGDNISISTGNVEENIRITGSLRLDGSSNTKLGIPTSDNGTTDFSGKMYWDATSKRLYIHDGSVWRSSSAFA
jgi:hypothetical protein